MAPGTFLLFIFLFENLVISSCCIDIHWQSILKRLVDILSLSSYISHVLLQRLWMFDLFLCCQTSIVSCNLLDFSSTFDSVAYWLYLLVCFLIKLVASECVEILRLSKLRHVIIGAGVPETIWSKLPVEVCILQAEWLSAPAEVCYLKRTWMLRALEFCECWGHWNFVQELQFRNKSLMYHIYRFDIHDILRRTWLGLLR